MVVRVFRRGHVCKPRKESAYSKQIFDIAHTVNS
jgi:hypothetical protein